MCLDLKSNNGKGVKKLDEHIMCSDRQTDVRNDRCSDRQTDVRKDILREISEKVVKLKIFYLCTDLSANNFIRSAMTQGVQICA